jgi:formylglycine-generating enzyme required for sulfatase activity
MSSKLKFLALVLCSTSLIVATAPAQISITTVPVGNPGNAPDILTGYGAVGYDYRIATSEVTVSQYAAFLNAVADADPNGLFNANMYNNQNIRGIQRAGASGSYVYTVIGSADHPISYVSWYDAARFVNWLENGQPTGAQGVGTTETGVYNLFGASSGWFPRNSPTGIDWGLPSENEWYKAAYYDSSSSSYYLYPTANNAVPNSRNVNGIDSNSGNFYRYVAPGGPVNGGYAVTGSTAYSTTQNYLTDVGGYSLALSPYGTFDQGGNVNEWNDGVGNVLYRGGAWNVNETSLRSTTRNLANPISETSSLGFRVVIVPEPAVGGMLALGIALLAFAQARRLNAR